MGEPKDINVCVVVLGDIGRSPRMQYHAQSLLQKGYNVDIIGYTDSPVHDDLKKNATIISVKKPLLFDQRKYIYCICDVLLIFNYFLRLLQIFCNSFKVLKIVYLSIYFLNYGKKYFCTNKFI